jgi:D-tyrosyl-tRNA(Tyr) deacylase
MRAVIQRTRSASVSIRDEIKSSIAHGLLLFVGIENGDTQEDGQWLAEKCAALRIFADVEGLMNRSVRDVQGGVLVISQFTLIASMKKGTRPSFHNAEKPSLALPLYEAFLAQLSSALGRPVAAGEFGADMQVSLVNDGPVTLVIDSRRRE